MQSLDWDAFSRMEAEWDRLAAVRAGQSLFSGWSWLATWWESFGVDRDAEFIGLVVRDPNSEIVGLVPFSRTTERVRPLIRVTRLQLLGDFHGGPPTVRTEYQTLNIVDAHRVEIVTAIGEHLLARRDWSDLVIKDLDASCAGMQLLCDVLAQNSHFRSIGDALSDRTWRVSTDGAFAEYKASLPQSRRRSMFHKRDHLLRDRDVALEWADRDQVVEYLQQLNDLHAIRWGRPVFGPSQLKFYRELCSHYVNLGQLRLSRVRVDGTVRSVLLDFVDGQCEYNLQLGFDDTCLGSRYSLGLIHLGFAIEHAFSCPNTQVLDLLAGAGKSTNYKKAFATGFENLRSAQFVRRGLTRPIHRVRDWRRNRLRPVPGGAIAVVSAAHSVTGYHTAVALAKSGVSVVGLASAQGSNEFMRSRVWRDFIRIDYSAAAVIESLRQVVDRFAGCDAVFFPCDDELVEYLATADFELPKLVRVVLPTKPAMRLLLQKTAFYDWSMRQALPVPWSASLSAEVLSQDELARFERPFIIKPSVRDKRWNDHYPSEKLLRIETADDLVRIDCAVLATLADEYVVQQWIPGDDDAVYFGLCFFDSAGLCRAVVGGRKLFQWPRGGGNTAACVTWDDPELLDLTRAVLRHAGMRGIGSMEFKRDADTGRYMMIEPTVGRSDHQSFLALSAGVNIPVLSFRAALGEDCDWVQPSRSAMWIDDLAVARLIRQSGVRAVFARLKKYFVGKPSFIRIRLADPRVAFAFLAAILRRIARQRRN
ncbi:MAG: GNAT family N-acetyltransferase [Pseudomonadota bacterium]